MAKTSPITRTIFVISVISLCTDIASEMLYPVLPLYFQHIGFSVAWIGVLEGCAEAVAGLSKGYFGQWSDSTGKRVVFIRTGYGLSALSKPLLGFITAIPFVFILRTFDRLGKGMRTGARDALLSAEATPQTKGAVFGFHRSMDTLGATLGPILALGYLFFFPGSYQALFAISVLPGIIAVILCFVLRDPPETPRSKRGVSLLAGFQYWKRAPRLYRHYAALLLAFALCCCPEMFLLLHMKEQGLTDHVVIMLYILFNAVYALMAYPLGILADKLGLVKMIITGLLIFATAFIGTGFSTTAVAFAFCMALYGCYAAATEGITKALLSNLVPPEETATAIGTFTGFQSITLLLAGVMTGLCWSWFGSSYTLLLSGCLALCIAMFLGILSQYHHTPLQKT